MKTENKIAITWNSCVAAILITMAANDVGAWENPTDSQLPTPQTFQAPIDIEVEEAQQFPEMNLEVSSITKFQPKNKPLHSCKLVEFEGGLSVLIHCYLKGVKL